MQGLLPPLKFCPIIKPLPWGGRRLEEILGKRLLPDTPCGESWEVVDLEGEQSLVEGGPHHGQALANILRLRREELMGEAELAGGRFPLLLKFIDAHQTLSVQVHPDEAAAARLGEGARPKTEAWYILEAQPEARLFLGLQPEATLADLRQALQEGSPEALLRAVEVKAGEFIFVPAGMLHAIGEGILLAEIQQASDTTFRLFDWGRLGLDGRPRPLHLEQALLSIKPELSGRVPHAFPLSGRPGVRCRTFSIERVRLGPGQLAPLDAGRPRLVCCLEGSGAVTCRSGEALGLGRGDTCLVPACRAESIESESGGSFLLVRI